MRLFRSYCLNARLDSSTGLEDTSYAWGKLEGFQIFKSLFLEEIHVTESVWVQGQLITGISPNKLPCTKQCGQNKRHVRIIWLLGRCCANTVEMVDFMDKLRTTTEVRAPLSSREWTIKDLLSCRMEILFLFISFLADKNFEIIEAKTRGPWQGSELWGGGPMRSNKAGSRSGSGTQALPPLSRVPTSGPGLCAPAAAGPWCRAKRGHGGLLSSATASLPVRRPCSSPAWNLDPPGQILREMALIHLAWLTCPPEVSRAVAREQSSW